jgi:hypothetical protein
MRITLLIVLSFLLTWLFAYWDHRATFLQLIVDVESLIVGMLLSAGFLYIAHQVLQNVFGGL